MTDPRRYDVASADGTRITAWTNDADGPTVLLCNGLGTNPHAWPSLLRADCGLHVISWNHRGVGGSDRGADERVDLDSYVEDALAVMDDADVTAAPLASWSAGVTVAFEVARRHPDRVTGIFAAAGVPGNTFGTMLEPLRIPGPVAKRIMVGVSRAGLFGGDLLAPLVKRIPWTRATADMLRYTHLVNPAADTDDLRTMLQEFCTTNPRWYATLALGVAEHERVSLSNIDVPVTFLAGRYDVLTGPKAMRSAAERIDGARYRELDGTHFITIEYPDVVLEELKDLVRRTGARLS